MSRNKPREIVKEIAKEIAKISKMHSE